MAIQIQLLCVVRGASWLRGHGSNLASFRLWRRAFDPRNLPIIFQIKLNWLERKFDNGLMDGLMALRKAHLH